MNARLPTETDALEPTSNQDARRVTAVIAGTGLLTPLGRTAGETWDALLAGRFIEDHSRAAGEFDPTTPRVIQMARRAADQALADAGWNPDDAFATVVGTSKGS